MKTIQTSNKNIILECRDGKRTKQNWDGGYLYNPFLHSTTVSQYVLHVHSVQLNAGMGNTDTLHPNSCFCSFPSLHLKDCRINFFVTSKNKIAIAYAQQLLYLYV